MLQTTNTNREIVLCLFVFVLWAVTSLYAAEGVRLLASGDTDYGNFLIRVVLIGNPQVILVAVAISMMVKGSFWRPYGYSEETFPLVVGCIGGLLSWGSFLDVNRIIGIDSVPLTGPLFVWNCFVHAAGSWALWEMITMARKLVRRVLGQSEQRKENGTR